MAQVVNVPKYGPVSFPDGMDDAAIVKAIKNLPMSHPDGKVSADGPTPVPTVGSIVGDVAKNLTGGALQHLGNIGAMLMASPEDLGVALGFRDKPKTLSSLVTGQSAPTDFEQRRADILGGSQGLTGGDPTSWGWKGAGLATDVAATGGVGGGIANVVRAVVPKVAAKLPGLLGAIESGGMTTGVPIKSGLLAGVQSLGNRVAGGAISGGAQAAALNPSDAGVGAFIGGVAPSAIKLIGFTGKGIANMTQSSSVKGGKLLASALNLDNAGLQRIAAAAQAAPESIVPGSKLTLSQALQQQGANDPSVQLLERTAAQGPGGDALLRRYQEQDFARMAALQAQGAQTYQGAASEEATRFGDRAGAVLRTQAGDDKTAARTAFETVAKKAAADGVALRLPLDQIDTSMGVLGRGTVGAGADARALVNEANNIGTLEVPAVTATKSLSSGGPRTMGQELRRLGGLSRVNNDGLGGEVSGLKGDLKNLVRVNGGMTPSDAAESLHQSGYLPDESVDGMFAALRAESNGKPVFSTHDMPQGDYRASMDAAMGDAPLASRVPVPVPYDEFQRLRRSAGALGAKVGERAGGETEAGVLNNISGLLTSRVDDAAAGRVMAGDSISPEFARQYEAARGMVRTNAERYKGGNNITSILRKPSGQDYSLTGDEITNKIFHGGAGLAGDVSNFRSVLNDSNRQPMMDSLQKLIMTQAAGKTTASGAFGAALPKFVEQRMPGLLEALEPSQMNALSGVASDIRNSEAAAGVAGMRGSDSYAKITRALDAGLLDSPIAKSVSKALAIKGIGAEWARGKLADMVVQNKGHTIAALLADPKAAAAALQDRAFVSAAGPQAVSRLRQFVLDAGAVGVKSLPVAGAGLATIQRDP